MDVVRRLIIWLACAFDWHEFDEATAKYPQHAGGSAKAEGPFTQQLADAWNRVFRYEVFECRHCGKLIRIQQASRDWPFVQREVTEYRLTKVRPQTGEFRLPGEAMTRMEWVPYYPSWHGPRTLRIRSVQVKPAEEQPHAN